MSFNSGRSAEFARLDSQNVLCRFKEEPLSVYRSPPFSRQLKLISPRSSKKQITRSTKRADQRNCPLEFLRVEKHIFCNNYWGNNFFWKFLKGTLKTNDSNNWLLKLFEMGHQMASEHQLQSWIKIYTNEIFCEKYRLLFQVPNQFV